MRPPTPVLLVPGWSNKARAMRRLARHMLRSGWPADRVRALDFGDRFGSNIVHAREVARAVEAIRMTTGEPRVDIVAHSMGGLATRRFIADHAGDPPVRRVIFLATPHAGTWAALLAFGGGGREMVPGSRVLRELDACEWPDQVEAIALRTHLDLRVFPPASAEFPCAENRCLRVVQGLLRSRRVHELVVEALLDRDLRAA